MDTLIWILNFSSPAPSSTSKTTKDEDEQEFDIGEGDYIFAFQVSAMFQVDISAFFVKYPKLWRRQISPRELTHLNEYLAEVEELSRSINETGDENNALKDIENFKKSIEMETSKTDTLPLLLKASEILSNLRKVRSYLPFRERKLYTQKMQNANELLGSGVSDVGSGSSRGVISVDKSYCEIGDQASSISSGVASTSKILSMVMEKDHGENLKTEKEEPFPIETAKPTFLKKFSGTNSVPASVSASASASTVTPTQTSAQRKSLQGTPLSEALAPQDRVYLSILASQRDKIQRMLQQKLKERDSIIANQAKILKSARPFQLDIQPDTLKLPPPEQSKAPLPYNPALDVLVPIRIDLDYENFKFRDTFTWHLQEKQITPEIFAEILCKDFGLPTQVVGPHIAKSIKEQLLDFSNYLKPPMPKECSRVPDLCIVIKLNITVGNVTLVDQFEWDINRYNINGGVDPEWFAEIMTAELGLVGEFRTAIAHSIREQIYWHVKSLISSGYTFDPENSYIEDSDLQEAFLPPAWDPPLREESTQDLFMPVITQLTEEELEKLEQHRERDARQKRRLNRGRRLELWALRDPPKTVRTLLAKGKAISDLIKLETHNRTISNSVNAAAFRRKQLSTISGGSLPGSSTIQPMLIPRSDPRTLLVAQPGSTAAGINILESELLSEK